MHGSDQKSHKGENPSMGQTSFVTLASPPRMFAYSYWFHTEMPYMAHYRKAIKEKIHPWAKRVLSPWHHPGNVSPLLLVPYRNAMHGSLQKSHKRTSLSGPKAVFHPGAILGMLVHSYWFLTEMPCLVHYGKAFEGNPLWARMCFALLVPLWQC